MDAGGTHQRAPAHDDISSGLSAIGAEGVTLSGERSRRTLSTFLLFTKAGISFKRFPDFRRS